jgi:hypothetical protein
MMQDCGLSIRVFKLHSIKDSFDLRPNGEKLRDGGPINPGQLFWEKKAVIPCTVRNLADFGASLLSWPAPLRSRQHFALACRGEPLKLAR